MIGDTTGADAGMQRTRKRRVTPAILAATALVSFGASAHAAEVGKRIEAAKKKVTKPRTSRAAGGANARQSATGSGPVTAGAVVVATTTTTTSGSGSGAVRPTTTVPPGGYTLSFPNENETETGVSGYRADIKQTLGNGRLGAMRGIEWMEQSDVPCKFTTLMRRLDGTDPYIGHYWSGCGDAIVYSSSVVEFTAERNFVRGIAVCDSKQNSNHRLKGIRLYGAKVWKTKPQIDHLDGSIQTTRPNCGTWATPVYCPRGMIATGVVVREDFDTSAVSAFLHAGQGLALLCQQVVWS